MLDLRTIEFKGLKGKHVIIRIDANVPFDGDKPKDSIRLTEPLKTLQKLQAVGARTIVLSHRGRPEGVDIKLSLRPIAAWYQGKLEPKTVVFQPIVSFEEIKMNAHSMAEGDVMFLENVRFHPGEKKNDMDFAEQLASLGEIYINEAFANSHRNHASMTGITSFIDSYAGPNVMEELKMMEPIVASTKHPFVAIVGGAKITSKLHAVEKLLEFADHVFIGGAIATAFFAAQGKDVGRSLCKPKEKEQARALMGHHAIRLPRQLVFKSAAGEYRSAGIAAIREDESIVDIGLDTVADIRKVAINAKMILWNGPVGIVEDPRSRVGSDAIAHLMAEVSKGSAYGVIGGGDTINLPEELGIADFIDHISTGGSAMLEYVGGQPLPALEVLKNK